MNGFDGTQDPPKQAKPTSKAPPKKEERPWNDDLQLDYDRILTVGEECISEAELRSLLLAKGRGSDSTGFNLYDGFEPSGRMHIAQGVFKAMNVNKCTASGNNGTFVFWVADWFALMNDKMGGDLDKIKTVGYYLIEVWKAAGMNLENVVFKWASEEITDKAAQYWPIMLDVARRFNITRIKKCCQIMGRLEGALTSAQVLYPLMQCTDVFFLKADICQLGVDQRKVNMLAREYCDYANIKRKPVILSHHMLYGLKAGQEKMSKSDPDSAVFMEDAAEDVERKIMNAYCPSKEQDSVNTQEETVDAGKASMQLKEDKLKNPCLDYIQNIIFSPPGATFTCSDVVYTDFQSVRSAFINGTVAEDQLKHGLVAELNQLLEPVRQHFTNDENAKYLLAQMKQFKKEESTAITEIKIRRLNLVSLNKVPADCHMVFAPLPSATPTLQAAVSILAQLQTGGHHPKVLYLCDWTARVSNACDADVKAITAFYSVLLTALSTLNPTLMKVVTIIYQSEAILADPSNYWISVINVGRHFMLNQVMGSDMKDSDGVGIVIGRLMKVADVMGVAPSTVSMSSSSASTVESNLVAEFYSAKLEGMTAPSVVFENGPKLVLQHRDDPAHITENDEYYLLDDPKVNGKSKMKKAFCEPGNTTYCPPISVVSAFSFGFAQDSNGEVIICRSEDNGGDRTYINKAEIEMDFQSGALHPGDLKEAASRKMVEVLEALSNAIKADGEANKAGKALKACAKKMSKKK
jgi:tyrosyl-tRNA synthetase